MKGKTCVITGATSGIGRACSLALGSLGANLVLLGRNRRAGDDVVRKLRRMGAVGSVEFVAGDLSDLDQVRQAASLILASHETLDVLINNAGARFDTYRASVGGFEVTFATNHLGHFLLTNLIINALQRSGAGRVITVSSSAHHMADGDGDWQLAEENYDRKQAYAKSKLANILFAAELGRRMHEKGIVSNAVDPGVVATNYARNNGLIAWAKHNLSHFLKRELRSAAKGAETVVYLASDQAIGNVSGKLFRDDSPVSPSSDAQDENLASRLWQESSELVGLGRDFMFAEN